MFTTYKNWNIEAITGYEPKTTFYMDFSIADRFGIAAIKDTFQRAFEHWKDNCEYLTELVMVLNWKQWEHHECRNYIVQEEYYELWNEASRYAEENLQGEELKYYFRCID